MNTNACFSLFCRNVYALGKAVWKKWKKRYFILVQVSQYTFAMCSYREKKPEPTELMQLDGYTVDYCESMDGRKLIQSHTSSRYCASFIGVAVCKEFVMPLHKKTCLISLPI